MTWTAHERVAEQTHIIGPCYIEDDEGTVRAEGICCIAHARLMALAPDLRDVLATVVAALDDASSVVDCGEDEAYAYEAELTTAAQVLAACGGK